MIRSVIHFKVIFLHGMRQGLIFVLSLWISSCFYTIFLKKTILLKCFCLFFSNPHPRTYFNCFFFFFKREKKDREREKHSLVAILMRDGTCNLGMSSDQESSPRPLHLWDDTPTNWPHWPGLKLLLLKINCVALFLNSLFYWL